MDLRFSALVLLLFSPLLAQASEFMDDDVLPVQEKVEFDKDKLYFDTIIYDPVQTEAWYAFDRKTHELVQLSAPPSLPAAGYLPMARQTSPDSALVLQTSTEKSYGSYIPDCEDDDDKPGSLTDLDTEEAFLAQTPKCLGPGTAEIVGDKLLVGAWESGDYSLAAPPVLVLDGKTHALLKSFDFAANVIRVDPYAPQTWLVGTEGAMLLDKDLNLKQRWYFYKGFRPGDHALALLVSDTPRKTDALAVVGAELKVPDQDAWYRAVSALPTDIRDTFSLYQFYMTTPGVAYYYLPKELNTLVPFFIDALARDTVPYHASLLVENLCRFDDPRVVAYMAKLAASPSPYGSLAGGCVEAHKHPHPKPTGVQ